MASLRATAFDVSVFTEFSNLTQGDVSNTSFGGNLEYISLAFPTRNPYTDIFERKDNDFKHALGFSLIPHTVVGYNINTTETLEDFGEINTNYVGSGGTYKFIVSNGAKYKNFSAGLNLGYLFGKINYSRDIEFSLLNAYNLEYETNYSISGFVWNSGFLYNH